MPAGMPRVPDRLRTALISAWVEPPYLPRSLCKYTLLADQPYSRSLGCSPPEYGFLFPSPTSAVCLNCHPPAAASAPHPNCHPDRRARVFCGLGAEGSRHHVYVTSQCVTPPGTPVPACPEHIERGVFYLGLGFAFGWPTLCVFCLPAAGGQRVGPSDCLWVPHTPARPEPREGFCLPAVFLAGLWVLASPSLSCHPDRSGPTFLSRRFPARRAAQWRDRGKQSSQPGAPATGLPRAH